MNSKLLYFSFGFLTFVCVLAVALALSPFALAHNHNGENYGKTAVSVSNNDELSIGELEQMLTLLKQLMALIIEHKQVVYQETKAAAEAHTEHNDEDAADDDHVMDMKDHPMMSTEKELIIEVESHTGKTQVHTRFVDKPESMFYVDAVLTDETKLIADIATKTGLTADEIKPALKYMGGN